MKRLFVGFVIVGLLFPVAVRAADKETRPRWSLEIQGGYFFPDIPKWADAYGETYVGEYGGSIAYKLLRNLDVGIGGSYIRAKGKGIAPTHGLFVGEATTEFLPLDVFFVARGIFSEYQHVVPYLGGGYTRLFYRQEIEGQPETRGSVNGYHARAGIQFLLDPLDPEAAKSSLQEYGLYHTYFFVEAKCRKATIDTVPSGSVNAGGIGAMGGLLVEF